MSYRPEFIRTPPQKMRIGDPYARSPGRVSTDRRTAPALATLPAAPSSRAVETGSGANPFLRDGLDDELIAREQMQAYDGLLIAALVVFPWLALWAWLA